jgi:hypothetical protein
MYDPNTGRFMTEDPSGFFLAGDPNLQRYVGNNPLSFTDPSGLAPEGHHWTPLNVLGKLLGDKTISQEEFDYLAGRYSGSLKPGNANTGYSGDHRLYDAEVEKELRAWKNMKPPKKKNDPKIPTAEEVADNIKAGKSFDGKSTNPVLKKFNDNICANTIDKTVDSTKDPAKVRSRGRSSAKARGLTVLVGFLAGAAAIGQRSSEGSEIARILSEGDAMQRALDAARRGDRAGVALALTNVSGPEESVYDQLMRVNKPFADAFLAAAEKAIEDE